LHFVIGLGNPGSRYGGTRHNIGFVVTDELVRRWGGRLGHDKFGNISGDISIEQKNVIIAQPQKFMNRSGGPTRALLDYYKGLPSKVIVVHDDLDLEFGVVRVKVGGGHGGHNGLRDLHLHLATDSYLRVRVGVGRPPEGWRVADFVLGKWNSQELAEVDDIVTRAADAVEKIVTAGQNTAMNIVNARARSQSKPA